MTAQPTTVEARRVPEHSNAYNIFILVLTVLSLGIMVLLILPLNQQTLDLLTVYDNLICVVFLSDFCHNLAGSRRRRDYFIRRRGLAGPPRLDPDLRVPPFTALLRLARLSRLARIARLLGGRTGSSGRGHSPGTAASTPRSSPSCRPSSSSSWSSVLVLQFEGKRIGVPIPDTTGHCKTMRTSRPEATPCGGGRHDHDGRLRRYVPGQRAGAADRRAFVMFAGVGIIGALASILANLLVSSPKPAEEAETERTSIAADPSAPATASPGRSRQPTPMWRNEPSRISAASWRRCVPRWRPIRA